MEDRPWFKHYPENMPKSVTYPKDPIYHYPVSYYFEFAQFIDG